MWNTPIQKIENHLYVKRDDLIPYSFGGNKARKGFLFLRKLTREITIVSSHMGVVTQTIVGLFLTWQLQDECLAI